MDKEIRVRIINIIMTLLFLIFSTYIWHNNNLVKAKVVNNTYFNNAYLSFLETSGGVLMENAYPIADSEGLKTKGYSFKVKNTSNKTIKYKLMFVNDHNNTLDNKYVKYSYNINDGEYSKPQTLSESSIIINDITKKSVNTYNIKLWIDDTAGNDVMNKTFSTRIGLESV